MRLNRFCALALILTGISPALSQSVEPDLGKTENSRPRVGLVLSGGGARGAAHIGVLKYLEQMRVPIDAIAGTSMGAVVGGLYASGLDASALEQVVLNIDWNAAFQDRTERQSRSFRRKQDDTGYLVKYDLGFNGGSLQLPKGLIQGQKLNLILRELTLAVSHIDDFDKLATPFRAVSADLSNGSAVVIDGGDLVSAMRSSMSVPGIFSPVVVDGRTLVDGGIANNIPIDVGREMGVDIIIAVDVGFPLRSTDELNSAVAIADQVLTLLIFRESAAQIASLGADDILLKPDIGAYSSTNFADVATVVAPGEDAARRVSGRLADLQLSEGDYQSYKAQRARVRRSPGTIDYVTVAGDVPLSPRVILSRLEFEPGDAVDADLIANDAARIYGLELFEHVDYTLEERDGQLGLKYQTVARSWGPNYLRLGLTFEEDFEGSNEFNVGARYIRTAVNRLGGEWRTDFQIGTNPRLATEFYQPLSFDLRYFISPELSYEQRNINVFDDNGDPFARYRLSNFQVGLSLGRELGNGGEFRVGIRRGDGDARLRIGDELLPNIDFSSGSYFVSLRRDTFDDPQFPRSGTNLSVEGVLERPELGSDVNTNLYSASWTKVRSFGRNTFAFGIDLATSDGDEPALKDFYSLGGFLNLSGLDRGQLRGPHAALTRVVYYRLLNDNSGLFDSAVYLGTSLEAGNVWQSRDEVDFESLRFNGSLFIGMDTFFGPLFFAAGFAENGDSTVSLFLGAPIR